MRKRLVWGGVAGLLISTSAGAVVLPGYAGFPSPFNDTEVWFQDEGRLNFAADDEEWHYFVIPIPVKENILSKSLTVKWQHTSGCTAPCLGEGLAEARLTTFHPNGSIASASSWDGTSGFRSQTETVPGSGGSAIFRVRMKMGSLTNQHTIDRVVSSGDAAL